MTEVAQGPLTMLMRLVRISNDRHSEGSQQVEDLYPPYCHFRYQNAAEQLFRNAVGNVALDITANHRRCLSGMCEGVTFSSNSLIPHIHFKEAEKIHILYNLTVSKNSDKEQIINEKTKKNL